MQDRLCMPGWKKGPAQQKSQGKAAAEHTLNLGKDVCDESSLASVIRRFSGHCERSIREELNLQKDYTGPYQHVEFPAFKATVLTRFAWPRYLKVAQICALACCKVVNCQT